MTALNGNSSTVSTVGKTSAESIVLKMIIPQQKSINLYQMLVIIFVSQKKT